MLGCRTCLTLSDFLAAVSVDSLLQKKYDIVNETHTYHYLLQLVFDTKQYIIELLILRRDVWLSAFSRTCFFYLVQVYQSKCLCRLPHLTAVFLVEFGAS